MQNVCFVRFPSKTKQLQAKKSGNFWFCKNEKLTNFFKSTRTFLGKHSPEILTGIGVTGMITTTVLAVKSTPKALILIEEKKKELGTDKLTTIEVVKAAWKPYIPALELGIA